jgi:hypothetical protein
MRYRSSAPWPERFWERVQKTDGCWFWLGRVDQNGYGNASVPRGL